MIVLTDIKCEIYRIIGALSISPFKLKVHYFVPESALTTERYYKVRKLSE